MFNYFFQSIQWTPFLGCGRLLEGFVVGDGGGVCGVLLVKTCLIPSRLWQIPIIETKMLKTLSLGWWCEHFLSSPTEFEGVFV